MAERKPNGNVAVLNRPLTDDVDAVNGTGAAEGADTGDDGAEGTEGTQASTEGATSTAAAAPRRNLDEAPDDEMVGITLRVPNGFRKLLAKAATEQKPAVSVPQMLATMAAEAFNYTLPKPERAPRLKRYDTPEDRKKAQQHDQQRQRLIARKVMESVENGILNVDMPELLAQVDAELKAKADQAAAAKAVATAGANEGTEGATDAAS